MRTSFAVLLLLPVVALIGCSDAASPPPPPKDAPIVGPHQGTAYALPDNLGYAEIVNEPEVTDRGATPTSIVVYFLQADAKSSLTPVPTDVKVKVDRGRRGSETLALKAEPKAGDAAGASRFASSPGRNELETLRCHLMATAGGKPVNISVSGSR